MTLNRLVLMCILTGAIAWPVQAAPRRYAISAEQIAATVSRMGVQIGPEQVELLADVAATSPAPSLQVRSVERFDSGRLIVRLECANSDDCVPFVASVQLGEAGATQLEGIASRASILKGAYPRSASTTSPQMIVMRNGSPATLQLDGDHVHITIPVICLGSGSAGQTIRATDRDHRRVFTAQVVENGLLRGKL